MAKYDTYSVKRVGGSTNSPITRDVTVLFEAGDNPVQVLEEADALLGLMDDPSEVPLEDALLAIPRSELIDLLRDVWKQQMDSMGNDKYQYANQLRNAISYAQNG